MPYAPKEDILAIMRFFRPSYTVNNISDVLQSLATADVNSSLVRKCIRLPATDLYDLLKSAEVCFYMEQAGMVKEVENAFGVIGQITVDKWTRKYENGMPMFFFAQGSSIPFLELLPHETWRMRGYKYVTSYVEAYANLYATHVWGAVSTDTTARGRGWDTDPDEWDDTEGMLV